MPVVQTDGRMGSLPCFLTHGAPQARFARQSSAIITFLTLAKRKQYIYIYICIGSAAVNHLFIAENLVIISIRYHISLRRCSYFPSMGFNRSALFLWRRCILRKCKLVSHNSSFLYIYIYSSTFSHCFMVWCTCVL